MDLWSCISKKEWIIVCSVMHSSPPHGHLALVSTAWPGIIQLTSSGAASFYSWLPLNCRMSTMISWCTDDPCVWFWYLYFHCLYACALCMFMHVHGHASINMSIYACELWVCMGIFMHYVNGSMWDCGGSSASAMELSRSYTEPSTYACASTNSQVFLLTHWLSDL